VRLGNSEAGSRSVGVVTGAHDVDDALNIRKNVLAGHSHRAARGERLSYGNPHATATPPAAREPVRGPGFFVYRK